MTSHVSPQLSDARFRQEITEKLVLPKKEHPQNARVAFILVQRSRDESHWDLSLFSSTFVFDRTADGKEYDGVIEQSRKYSDLFLGALDELARNATSMDQFEFILQRLVAILQEDNGSIRELSGGRWVDISHTVVHWDGSSDL
jgi:hypothetical protein